MLAIVRANTALRSIMASRSEAQPHATTRPRLIRDKKPSRVIGSFAASTTRYSPDLHAWNGESIYMVLEVTL